MMSNPIKRHSILQTIFFHLIPGALITIAFVLLGPWLRQNHLPPPLALLIPILVVLLPVELGGIIFLGIRHNKKLSLNGIILNPRPIPMKEYFLLIPPLLIWSVVVFMLLKNFDQAILEKFFYWLPNWFQIGQFDPGDYSQPLLNITFILFLVLNGLAGPVAEELYFRGFLLPRMEYLKGWAPLVNTALFSLYHFFSPWQFITRILAFYPLAFVVRRKNNIFLSLVTHCLLNIGYCLLSARLFF